jgi:hypothetical protein
MNELNHKWLGAGYLRLPSGKSDTARMHVTCCPPALLSPSLDLRPVFSCSSFAPLESQRDGMNLVSYEYVACQSDNAGVLVLSEFAGEWVGEWVPLSLELSVKLYCSTPFVVASPVGWVPEPSHTRLA